MPVEELVKGEDALNLIGVPISHGKAFQHIAYDQRSIIISREIGTVCTSLLEEGHETKGFRIHAILI